MGLPLDRGVRHAIDLTRSSDAKHEEGLVRESKSPHSTPTFCVRKPNGKWRIVHAFNELNAATIPAQTPIPRKDVLQNNMVGCTLGEHSERDALGVAGDAPGAVERTSNVRANPAKVKSIVEWPIPKNQQDLRKWLGFANYLHKNSANNAEMARPLSNLLKKDAPWCWEVEHDEAFQVVNESLLRAPILAQPDPDCPFSDVCDASDFAIRCDLLQADVEGRERVIAFQARQLKAAEKNYLVHDE
ncbi:hypothetical protein PC119_g5854 [Phytophthora cactorum]|uniref:Reverse transcriptase/retrotransposon-derived protein RNase H-like domain-containing protein n=2 Tax=Phytophthora cactorum TaxID=29920 RepID=A0A8T0ZHI5_9STRA|nr:hypothetical protein PC113_g6341 [Phytophthora cactorum]KAG2919199.1 hypothetical protein PC114_g6538 [Phytophthora cactorum]KAG2948182.1 hypothetical protein PC117_g6227 [Phytophthora cactorum]KAG3031736.1 hypothetical protein PC119_g5854 [Phytophthora cactorum]